jgi:hypothetical protein
MNEYLRDVLIPALKAFELKKVLIGSLLSIIPILNLFFIPGYALTISKYLGKGKEKYPDIRILDAVTVTILTAIGLVIFSILLALISVLITIFYNFFNQITQETVSFTSINILSLISIGTLLTVFLALNLILNFMYPIVAVRYQIYQYYSRIYDIHHILKLVFTKEYIFSYIISVLLFFGIITPINLFLHSLIFYYLAYFIALFVISIISFSLFGRAFYILETKYKIDHIPKHAKSEISAVELD